MNPVRKTATAVAVAAFALPGAAQASTITMSGAVLTYSAAPGETNNVTFTLGTEAFACGTRPAPCLDVAETSEVAITAYPAGQCADDGYGTVECAVPTSIVANLGDRDDSLFDWEGPSTIDGGAGNEVVLEGRGGADAISGGPGNDALFGGDGNDTLDGGDGDDYLEGFGTLALTDPVSTGGADAYVGGPGKDLLDYAGRTEPMQISLDGGANDGAAGEADNVGQDVEGVRGGNGADTITGNGAANSLDGWDGDDSLHGGAGDDSLFGRTGADAVSGEGGQDTIEGGDGDDTVDGGADLDVIYGDELQVCIPSDCATGRDVIRARDGVEESVSCGPGTDTATLDQSDRVPASGDDVCEQIDRAGAAGGGGGGGGGGTGTGPGGGPGGDQVAPQLQRLRVGGTTIRYSLSEPATVAIRFQRRVRSGWVKVRGTIRHTGIAGANTLRFNGRVGGRRLRPGAHRVVAVATDAAGNRRTARSRTFRVQGRA